IINPNLCLHIGDIILMVSRLMCFISRRIDKVTCAFKQSHPVNRLRRWPGEVVGGRPGGGGPDAPEQRMEPPAATGSHACSPRASLKGAPHTAGIFLFGITDTGGGGRRTAPVGRENEASTGQRMSVGGKIPG